MGYLRNTVKKLLPEKMLDMARMVRDAKYYYSRYETERKYETIQKEVNDAGRTICLGEFLSSIRTQLVLRQLTHMPGGSRSLDYAFLRAIAIKFNCKNYCEIGTYIGESINVLTDVCEVCHSITAGDTSPFSMVDFCKEKNIPCFSNRLATASNIVHHYVNDSKTFDYSLISDSIDLYFIDGDHQYMSVYADTRNVFSHRHEDSFVVWHDFKGIASLEVGQAIKDVLHGDMNNVYCCDTNLCAIYIPPKYQKEFPVYKMEYKEAPQDLWVYDTVISVHRNIPDIKN